MCACVCVQGRGGTEWQLLEGKACVSVAPAPEVCVFTFESLREEMVDEEATISQRVRHENKLTLQQREAKLVS